MNMYEGSDIWLCLLALFMLVPFVVRRVMVCVGQVLLCLLFEGFVVENDKVMSFDCGSD